jgi:hypothetical protein
VSVAPFIQHAKRMRHITLSFVVCPSVSHVSALSHKRQDFRENVNESNRGDFVFSTTLSEIFLILRRIETDIITNVHKSTCTVHLSLSDFSETRNFVIYFRKMLKYRISCRSIQWKPTCSMQADGQTNIQKERHVEASNLFSKFYETPKMIKYNTFKIWFFNWIKFLALQKLWVV